MQVLKIILNIIFPIKCLGCEKNGEIFCPKCLSSAPLAERENPEWIFSLFDYRHPPIKKAVWLLKYKKQKYVAGFIAELIYGKISEELADLSPLKNFQNPILIPVPLAPKRKRDRGFNQAELICKKLMTLDKKQKGNNFQLGKNILIKPKDTEHQAKIENRAKRLKNVIGSFLVQKPEKIKNRNIILIDDVTTTGATLTEAKKVLKQAGAKKIIAFTLAH